MGEAARGTASHKAGVYRPSTYKSKLSEFSGFTSAQWFGRGHICSKLMEHLWSWGFQRTIYKHSDWYKYRSWAHNSDCSRGYFYIFTNSGRPARCKIVAEAEPATKWLSRNGASHKMAIDLQIEFSVLIPINLLPFNNSNNKTPTEYNGKGSKVL